MLVRHLIAWIITSLNITKVLEKVGVCQDIFKLLYNDITAEVLINCFLSDSFSIQRSVKQGDALPCDLFIMCMDIVISKLNSNTGIKPIKVMNSLAP